jgi:hypothetical protein
MNVCSADEGVRIRNIESVSRLRLCSSGVQHKGQIAVHGAKWIRNANSAGAVQYGEKDMLKGSSTASDSLMHALPTTPFCNIHCKYHQVHRHTASSRSVSQ